VDAFEALKSHFTAIMAPSVFNTSGRFKALNLGDRRVEDLQAPYREHCNLIAKLCKEIYEDSKEVRETEDA